VVAGRLAWKMGEGWGMEMEALIERAYAPLAVLLPQLLCYYCVELHETEANSEKMLKGCDELKRLVGQLSVHCESRDLRSPRGISQGLWKEALYSTRIGIHKSQMTR
jgi:hypothetical protein